VHVEVPVGGPGGGRTDAEPGAQLLKLGVPTDQPASFWKRHVPHDPLFRLAGRRLPERGEVRLVRGKLFRARSVRYSISAASIRFLGSYISDSSVGFDESRVLA
jgi:hypothetical protein